MKTRTMALWLMIVLGIGVIGSLGLASSTPAYAADLKIGFVDLQRVISGSEEGKRAQADIQKKADEFTEQVNQLKTKIDTLTADYKKQADLGALSANAKREKQDEISKLQTEYDRRVKDSRDELAKAEDRALKAILQEVSKVVVDYGKQNGFTVILEAGNILYGAENIDITNDIVNQYNSRPK